MIELEYNKISNRVYSELDGHCHSFYEIYYFISGNARLMVEGKLYNLTPHSLFLLAPNVYHGIDIRSRADYIRHILYITPQDLLPERRHLLTDVAPDHKKNPHLSIVYEHTEAFHLEEFYRNIKQLETAPPNLRQSLEQVYAEALLAQVNLLCRTLKPSTFVSRTPDKISEIIDYLNLHLTEPHTLDSIAAHFYISKNYLNKTFKKYFDKTVIEYIRYKRVILAKQYLQNGESAIDAALQSGFSDYSTFYRSYVKYEGDSPRHTIDILKENPER